MIRDDQLNLFAMPCKPEATKLRHGLARSRKTDPDTSHAAARKAAALTNEHYRKILKAIRKAGPGTFHDIALAAGLHSWQVHKRLPELRQFGIVKPTGYTLPSPYGRACRVWGLV